MQKKKAKKWILPVIVGGLVVLAGLSFLSRTHVYQVRVLLPNGQTILADVADSPEEHLMGFFMAGSLPDDRGILMIYEEAGLHRFWGRNVRFPIDIIWLDPNRQIVRVDENVPPCSEEPCPTYESDQAILFVLHVAAGVSRQHGLKKGMSLEFRKIQPEEAEVS